MANTIANMQKSIDELTKALASRTSSLESKIAKLNLEINKKDSKISDLEKNIAKIEMNLKNPQSNADIIKQTDCNPLNLNEQRDWSTVIQRATNANQSKLPISQIEVMNSVATEQIERNKRKPRLIMFGLSVQAPKNNRSSEVVDREQAEKILESINTDVSQIKKCHRLKAYDASNKISPIILTLNDNVNRNSILALAKNLYKNEANRNIYINPDLTEAERYLEKQLRDDS